jgi:energy-coupling factor transport system substrate-specific component
MGNISDGAKYHHERIDGKGYEGLHGDEIPLIAKIICVCNSFDNMLMSGKREVSMEKVQSELVLGAGTKYDEKVTAVLISMINEGEVPYEHKKTA